nr:alpha-amylase family glycosyl hydrolase [uncultured Porphyromonas sp.]
MRISIYQVLPRLFGNLNATNQKAGTLETNGSGKFEDFTPERLQEIKELGCTHIWYTGVLEHATKSAFGAKLPANHPAIVKGEAGSPYAIRDYYDVAPALAVDVEHRMEEFEALIERTHAAGLKVIIDFVPNHLSREYASDAKPSYVKDFGEEDDTSVPFAPNNNFYYLPQETLTLISGDEVYTETPAKATGNDQFTSHPTPNDWYETIKLNYGIDLAGDWNTHYDPVPDTWNKMLDILNYWAAKGVDGFRCDMAELVPVPFWQWCIQKLKTAYPELLMIAEVYQPERYEEYVLAGFDYLYDKVGLYDLLIALLKGQASTNDIGGLLQSQERVKHRLLRFMENHDEVRLASDFVVGDGEKAFPAMAVTALVDGNPLMTYFGQELGERGMDEEGFSGRDGRTTIFDYWSLSTIREWLLSEGKMKSPLRTRYQSLLELAQRPLFAEGTFYDLNYYQPHFANRGLHAFMRAYGEESALVVVNFHGEPQMVEVAIPSHAFEVLSLSSEVARVTQWPVDGETFVRLLPDQPYQMEVPAYGVTVHLFSSSWK